MKLRIGTVVAFAVGYTLGARAGEERYAQIARMASQLGQSGPVLATVGVVSDRAKAVVALSVERARDVVGNRFGLGGSDDMAEHLAGDLAAALNGRRH